MSMFGRDFLLIVLPVYIVVLTTNLLNPLSLIKDVTLVNGSIDTHRTKVHKVERRAIIC